MKASTDGSNARIADFLPVEKEAMQKYLEAVRDYEALRASYWWAQKHNRPEMATLLRGAMVQARTNSHLDKSTALKALHGDGERFRVLLAYYQGGHLP